MYVAWGFTEEGYVTHVFIGEAEEEMTPGGGRG